MKRIEDIEALSQEDLEKISFDGSVRVPEGLVGRLEAVLSEAEDGRRTKKYRTAFASLAVGLAAALAALVVFTRQPEDTYDDPGQAYAAVERTFAYISEEIDKGMDIVKESAPALEMPAQVISKINNR